LDRQAIVTNSRESLGVWRLAVREVPPSDVCNVSMLQGTWRLAARVACQAVWKRILPGGSGATLSDIVEAYTVFWLFWICVFYKTSRGTHQKT